MIITISAWVVLYCSISYISITRWTIIYEYSHLIVAKIVYNVQGWEMKTVPCYLNGRAVGGYVKFQTLSDENMTNYKSAAVSLAPFLTSTMACIIIPITAVELPIVAIALFGGLIDHVEGSMAPKDLFWDMPSAANKLNISLNKMKAFSLIIPYMSIIVTGYVLGTSIATRA